MIMDILSTKAKKSPVCLGLDTKIDYVPAFINKKDMSDGEKIFEFNKRIIDACKENVACFKVQIAYYEALGLDGMKCYSKTLRYIRENGCIAIADIKRGDISETASRYALAHFQGDFEADIVTLNTYMGEDAISPFYPYLSEKGVFALVKTSNPSGKDLQDIITGSGELVYERMAKIVSFWGQAFLGKSGFSSIGAVVGCNKPREFEKILTFMPNTFFLIPGYGAQGGTGKDLQPIFRKGICGVVNASRSIIAAHVDKCEDESFTDFTAQAVSNMKEDIMQWLR